MPELVVSQIDTERLLRPQPALERAATAVTAFIGRSLKGPVDLPVALTSFDDYQRIFGGLWQPSSLSYAVEQYFENGGRSCLVVRVCNGGRAPTLTLRCGEQALVLVGLLRVRANICAWRSTMTASRRRRPTASTWWCNDCAPPAPN